MTMPQIKHNLFINIVIIFWVTTSFGKDIYNIGFCIMATGKYIQFVPPLITSAKKYFCPDHNVTFFVFTDSDLKESKNVIRIEQKKLGWPSDTLMRFSVYYQHKNILANMDYLFACDADMLFVDYVGNEILGNLVGTLHPGFFGKDEFPYETNPISTAYINKGEEGFYFAGGFNGGTNKEFIKMAKTITNNIKIDLEHNYIAVWHDESHLNKYFNDNKPTIMLSSSYCCPENAEQIGYPPYKPRLIARDKNHDDVRIY